MSNKKISLTLALTIFLITGSQYACANVEENTAIDTTSVQTVIIPSQKATFSATMKGKIISLPYEEGEIFWKDSPLFTYDCTIQKATLREKEAAKNAAWAEYISTKKLKALNSASELELTLALMAFRKTDAAVDIEKEKIKNCKMKAPFNGRVVERKVNLYETTNAGQELMSVVSRDKLHARMLIPSQWLKWLEIGTTLSVTVQEFDETYPAKIIRIGGAVDEVSQSIPVIAEISKNTENLLPGMSGTAVFNNYQDSE